MASVLKRQFKELKNGKSKKNQTYYFHNDIINVEESDSDLLKIGKKSYEYIDIYYIGYVKFTKVDDSENIDSVNTLYLKTGKVDGHIECNSIKEKNRSTYLAFDSIDENNEVLKKYTELWDRIKNDTETINGNKVNMIKIL